MQSYTPPAEGSAAGQLLLRWGFFILGIVGVWLGLDRLTDWSAELQSDFADNLILWLEGTGLIAWGGVLFGIALRLPVLGRGFKASAFFGLSVPLLLVNAFYAVVFNLDADDLPEFVQDRLFVHPLLSGGLASIMALLFGASLVNGFTPAGYMPLSRLKGAARPVEPYAAPPAQGPPPEQGPPPTQPGPPDFPTQEPYAGRHSTDMPDNQQTRELPGQDL
jgi:hypothetical protein